jgi:hypothetical protein
MGSEAMKPKTYDRERLLFRRQFILGPRFLEGFPNWQRVEVRPALRVTAHPDLPVVRASDGDRSVLLIGYILDPFQADATDADILRGLLTRVPRGEPPSGFTQATSALGGRWILLVDDGRSPWLFHDPCGYRQVFHTSGGGQGVWCASQPGLLAETLGLRADPDASAFIQGSGKRNPQYWWPLDTSPYKNVRRLLPNHYLDLETGRPHRFWPDEPLASRRTDDMVAENAPLLRNLILSAASRFDLALSITAGGDTRLVLAASKPIASRLYCFTLQYWDMDATTPDVWIPPKLLAGLGLKHHPIPCPSRMDPEFREIYERNVTTARRSYGSIAQGLYNSYPADRVCLKGNAIPLTAPYYRRRLRRLRPDLDREKVDAGTLGYLTRREEPFALEAFDRWLAEVPETNIDPLILFWWEDREGSWQAMSQLEWDIAQEVLVPFNCRRFLTNLLSVPGPDRMKPAYVAHRKLAGVLWPEVLREPINPPMRRTVISTAREYLLRPGRKDWKWLHARTVQMVRRTRR